VQTSPYFRPKWAKPIPYFRPKRLKNHTLQHHTYLYSLYKGVPPLPPREEGNLKKFMLVREPMTL